MNFALRHKIASDFKTALSQKKQAGIRTLRLLNAAVTNQEKEKRYKLSKHNLSQKELEKQSQLTDGELLAVISSEVKKRKESILAFEKGQRQDLVEKEKEELAVLKGYLPVQLSEEQLGQIVRAVIREVGATSAKDLGKVMAKVMAKVKGQADGQRVSQMAKQLL